MFDIKEFNNKILHEDFEVTTKKRIELLDRKNLKKGEKIPIVNNTMFKTLFYNTERLKYSAKLLSYFIDIDYDHLLKHMRLAKNEIDKEMEYAKGEMCDYIAEINNTYLAIEMNCNTKPIYLERNLDYCFKWYSKKNKVGKEYVYKQLIMLNINNFSFKGLDKTYYINSIGNKEYSLTKKIIFIDIYLPNIVKKCYTKGIESLNEWERYLMALTEKDVEQAKEYAKGDHFMNESINEAENVSFELHIGESYDHEEAERDQIYEDGKKDGIEKNKKETAIALLKSGIDRNTISECTKLSIQELEKLQANV